MRARRMKLRVWPDSLFGRLVAILAAGMFAGQMLTGTIWFDTHDNRMLEIPARLFASRLADTLRLVDAAPDAVARDAVIAALGDARYRLRRVDAPSPAGTLTFAQHATAGLIAGVLSRRLGADTPFRLVDAELHDDTGRHAGPLSLFDSRMPTGEFHVQVGLPSGGWLDVRADEGQAGMHAMPASLVVDYLLRLYLIRFVAVCAVAFVAVRFALKPLTQLARAAEALGRDIHRPPLAVDGPSEVRSAAESFNAMQRQLIDSFAGRARFLGAVSHDLRTPLTRLRLRTEMLPDPEWRDRLRGDLDEMESMVRSALDAVRGVEVTEPRRGIDLDSMLEGLAEDARDTGQAVVIRGHASAPVSGFARNLKRCLQNLLDNAAHYSGGAPVTIDVRDGKDAVRIVVSDTGPGLPDDWLERVFEPYRRGAHADRDDGGTGLGLTIARSIATLHGGTLTLRNRDGGGLDAILALPRDGA